MCLLSNALHTRTIIRTIPCEGNDSLESICGLEYAAQAMAIHVGLSSPSVIDNSSIGYLGGVRNLVIESPRLDTCRGPITIHANLLLSQGYNFYVCVSH